jgi:beta-N-acetylglucosaminidase/SH3-like domain-containing protein
VKSRIKVLSTKLVSIITILTLLTYILINFINENKTYAEQYNEAYDANKIANYPGYKELIEKLKAEHPNWNFTIFYTGLDWNQVIKNETTAYHGRNVVPASKASAWKCSICGDTPRGGSSWRCASEAAVAYYMDPRNWINDDYIFQFETLSYNESIQTIEGVQKIISNIKYMQGDTVTYTDTDGNKVTLNKSYAQIIMEAAKEANISPYHLASRLKQEQGTGTNPGDTAKGTYSGYTGYYNFLNISASGSTDSEVTKNGLQYAQKNNWTNPEISIIEGAKILAKNYINDGQDTLYLQKFDVDSSDGTLYYFQYMQNVSACITEGANAKKAYEELGLLNSSIDFRIPVYENMPTTPCGEPIQAEIVTQNVQIKGTNVNIRSGASTSAQILVTVSTGYSLLRIELASTANEGVYWDKVVLPDGRKGYVSRSYIEQIADITECNDTVITNTTVNLRNGPGTTGTTVVTTLIKGQALTRIEKGKYNIDGYVWDRVKLADGRQGYIAQNYIDSSTSTSTGEVIKVICSSGLKVREQAGTDKKVLTYVVKGETLTRIEAGSTSINGYIWDKIVTNDGIEGYIARGTATENYIEVVSNVESGNTSETSNNNFKLENDKLISEPQTTVETIKDKYSDKQITVKNAKGETITTGNIGTGYTVTIGDETYTAVKMGDVNGDGKVNTVDALNALKYDVGSINLTTEQIEALDVNKDNKVNTVDALVLLKYDVGLEKIDIETKN